MPLSLGLYALLCVLGISIGQLLFKKAAAALHWGVAEMTDRYQRFADFNVRDLKGYNKKLEEMQARGETEIPAKMPQIVIIVDELADLMMVAPGEVEDAICRLAQLARAAGIHLLAQRTAAQLLFELVSLAVFHLILP